MDAPARRPALGSLPATAALPVDATRQMSSTACTSAAHRPAAASTGGRHLRTPLQVGRSLLSRPATRISTAHRPRGRAQAALSTMLNRTGSARRPLSRRRTGAPKASPNSTGRTQRFDSILTLCRPPRQLTPRHLAFSVTAGPNDAPPSLIPPETPGRQQRLDSLSWAARAGRVHVDREDR